MGLKPGARPAEPLRAFLRELDLGSGEVVRDLSWTTPADLVAGPSEHCELTASSWVGRILVQPTRSEILWVDVDRWQVTRSWSHPLLHDVHHALERPGGGLVVVATGHDSVLEFDAEGVLVAHHWLGPGRFTDAHPGVDDFRTVPFDRFKPHTHHPNHAVFLGDELWVTLLRQGALVSLTTPGRRIEIPQGPPHDGVLREGLLWVTTVTGHVLAFDPVSLEQRMHLDLRALTGAVGLLGWCRGIEVTAEHLFVGLTALRSSRSRELLRRAVRGPRGRKLPTRIVQIERSTQRVIREIPVGNDAGGTLYAIHAWDGPRS